MRREPRALRLGICGDEFSYAIDLGLPAPGASAFANDAEIKTENIWHGTDFRPASQLVERRNSVVRLRRDSGDWEVIATQLRPSESVMEAVIEPQRAAEVLLLREQIRSWRFYDYFQADSQAPVRQLQVGTYTPVLAADGRDLASALQTIRTTGDGAALAATIADAFQNAELIINSYDGRLAVALKQYGLLRPLSAAELSDGTLRYLLWTAALLTPRPPQLMVLNEPETSLHPDLLPALARLISVAAKRTQLIVVTHAGRLAGALKSDDNCLSVELDKELGETRIVEQLATEMPPWRWPNR